MINIPVPVSATTAAAPLVLVPPGPCTVVISNDSASAGAAYVGLSNAVTASNGFPLPVGATVTIPAHPGAAPTDLWVISASTSTVGVIVSTTN